MLPFVYWNCPICKAYNDGLNTECVICYTEAPEHITGYYQGLLQISRGIFLKYGVYSYMNDAEELFKNFYNAQRILIKDMTLSELNQLRAELSKVAYEAKARLTATDDDLRERKAKDKKSPWLVSTDDNVNVSDAINTVKTRQSRMSKMDKMREQLMKTLDDKDLVDEMIRNLEKRATENNLKSATFDSKKPLIVENQVTEKSVVMIDTAEKPVFNPSNLKFGS